MSREKLKEGVSGKKREEEKRRGFGGEGYENKGREIREG